MEIKKEIPWIWPTIFDSITAQKASRQGFWAAIFNAIVTAVMIFLGSFNLFSLVDIVIFVVIAFGIYKMYRTASVAGLCLYILERIDSWLSYGFPNTTIRAATFIIITLMFINSIRGTFAYYKYKMNEK